MDTDITYENKLVDTHNAIDRATGTFTAPFDGVYGFFFFANFLDTHNGFLFAQHNNNRFSVFERHTQTTNTDQSATVYFAVAMKQNDKVTMYSGNTVVQIDNFTAKFSGFLIQSRT